MRQLTTIAALVVALVTPAAARSRLVVLDRPTLACSDQQALETALTLARLHDGTAFRDHASSYGCMWIEPDDGPLAVVGAAVHLGVVVRMCARCYKHPYSVSVSERINFTERSSVGQAGLRWPRGNQTPKRRSLPLP